MDTRLLVLALGSFAGTMENFVLPGLLPGISAETGVSMAQAGYLAFAYSMTYAVAAPVLSATFGASDRRVVLVSSETMFALSALFMAVAASFPLMLAGRVVLSCAAALFTSMAQATAIAISAPERRGRAVSVVLTGGTIAVAVGAPFGALIAVHYGWRWTFGLTATLGFIAAVVMWLQLPSGIVGERRSLAERLGVVALPGVPTALLISLLFMVGAFCPTIYVAAVTIQSMGLAKEFVPFVLLANGLGAVAGGIAGGQLIDRLGPFRTSLLMTIATCALLVAISLLPMVPSVLVAPLWLATMGLSGLAGWAMFASQLALLSSLAPQSVPLAVSLNLSAVNIGAAVAAVVGSFILDRFGAGQLGLVGAGFVAAALLLSLASRASISRPKVA